MSLRTIHIRNKTVSDIKSVDDRVNEMEALIAGIFSDLTKLQNFINNSSAFNAEEETEIQNIIDEAYTSLWDGAVARTPIAIKDTNRA